MSQFKLCKVSLEIAALLLQSERQRVILFAELGAHGVWVHGHPVCELVADLVTKRGRKKRG